MYWVLFLQRGGIECSPIVHIQSKKFAEAAKDCFFRPGILVMDELPLHYLAVLLGSGT